MLHAPVVANLGAGCELGSYYNQLVRLGKPCNYNSSLNQAQLGRLYTIIRLACVSGSPSWWSWSCEVPVMLNLSPQVETSRTAVYSYIYTLRVHCTDRSPRTKTVVITCNCISIQLCYPFSQGWLSQLHGHIAVRSQISKILQSYHKLVKALPNFFVRVVQSSCL